MDCVSLGDDVFEAQLSVLAAASDVLPCLAGLPGILAELRSSIQGLRDEAAEFRLHCGELKTAATAELRGDPVSAYQCRSVDGFTPIAKESSGNTLPEDCIDALPEVDASQVWLAEPDAEEPTQEVGVRFFFKGQKAGQGRVRVLRRSTSFSSNGMPSLPALPAGLVKAKLQEAGVDFRRFAAHCFSESWQSFQPLPDNPSELVQSASAPGLGGCRTVVDVQLEELPSFTERAIRSLRFDLPDGYFGIGIVRGKTMTNHGLLWRSAFQMGGGFTFTVGARFDPRTDGLGDTYGCAHNCPQWTFSDFADFSQHMPFGAPIVAIEMGGVPLDSFEHPERCVYLLGSEDAGLPPAMLQACHAVVSLPSIRAASFNVAVAGSIVMHDRLAKERKAQLHRAARAEAGRFHFRNDKIRDRAKQVGGSASDRGGLEG